MSVRNALLALVSQRPAGVYRLKQAFEDQTGGAWPLNIGQVYQTMQRLERDGLVTSHPETNAGRDSEVFVLTDEGDAELESWWNHPVPRGRAERDELVMKLAVAATDDSVDLSSVIQQQRRATMQALRDLTRLKGDGRRDGGGLEADPREAHLRPRVRAALARPRRGESDSLRGPQGWLHAGNGGTAPRGHPGRGRRHDRSLTWARASTPSNWSGSARVATTAARGSRSSTAST